MVYRFWRAFFRMVLVMFSRWKVYGAGNVPTNGPVLLVANHVSNWDPIIVGCALERQVCYMAKEELFNAPVIGRVLPLLAAFPIKRGKSDIAALRTALDLLAEGRLLGMFPEGTRSKTGAVQDFKSGIAMLAYKAHCPVVPVALINSTHVLNGWLHPVKVFIGEAYIPQLPEGKASSRDLERITKEIQDRVVKLFEVGTGETKKNI